MNLFGWEFSLQRKTATTISLDTLIRRLEAVYETTSGVGITPENCMQSPTVHAIVTGLSRFMASCPVHVYQKGTKNGRDTKEPQPSHPVERLLNKPNDWQSRVDYWQDATSSFLRYGRFCAFKARGSTGPIRRLIPLIASAVEIKQDDQYNVTYVVTQANSVQITYSFDEMHYVRGPARDFLKGDSPVMDCREAIALEIAAERFGGALFGNGATPGLIFEFLEGFKGFKTDEEKRAFIADFQASQTGKGRWSSILMPKGMKLSTVMGIENEKAQYLELRKHQRTVIAGAFGVPLYMVGDLERQTFNNSEQQALNKVMEVGLPIVRTFEAAMERDLLTTDDRNGGVIIRFNLDGLLRGDFKTRQEGLKIQRENSVINANEWREVEGYNPRQDPEGEAYWNQGPSGQNAQPMQQQPPVKPNGNANPATV